FPRWQSGADAEGDGDDAPAGLLHRPRRIRAALRRPVHGRAEEAGRLRRREAAVANAIVAEGLTKKFGSRLAVDRVDLSTPQGEIFGLLGPNGSGKTTMIRMLCGVLAPSVRRAMVGGYDVGREPEKVKRVIGYVS